MKWGRILGIFGKSDKNKNTGWDSRAFRPKMFAAGGERCPLNLYKQYESHRPATIKGKDSPF